MTHQLVNKAFEKALKETYKESLNGRAEYLSEYILEEFRYTISPKSLIRYFKRQSTPNMEVLNALSGYLGYSNYQHYLLKNNEVASPSEQLPASEVTKSIIFERGRKRTILATTLLVILIITGYAGFLQGKEDCMVWMEDHYEKTSCTGSEMEQSLNQEILENLKKIEVTDTTEFFRNGKVQVWYEKTDGELEFFSYYGIHPENGKTLKPITPYMIEKYVR